MSLYKNIQSLLFTLLLFTNYLRPGSIADNPPSISGEFLSTEAAPSSFVNNSVNAIHGNFFTSDVDVSVLGARSLLHKRSYNSSLKKNDTIGIGFSENNFSWVQLPLRIVDYQETDEDGVQDVNVILSDEGGSIFQFYGRWKGEYINLNLDPVIVENGLTNYGDEDPSGQTNWKNSKCIVQRLRRGHKNEKAVFTFQLGNGEKREFRLMGNSRREERLHRILRPDGSVIQYDYSVKGGAHTCSGTSYQLKKIKMTSQQGIEFGWLEYDYFFNKDTARIKSSDGKEVEYKVERSKKEKDLYLSEVTSSNKPKVKYEYNYKQSPAQIVKVVYPNGRYLVNEYKDRKVIAQKAPVGKDNQPITIYTFDYQPKKNYTVVKDAYNNQTIYRYNKQKRLTDVEKYVKTDGTSNSTRLYRVDKFYWGQNRELNNHKDFILDKGDIIAKVILDGNNKVYICNRFTYDDYGNVVENALFGNLQGTQPCSFEVYDNGRKLKGNFDRYTVWSKYSKDGMNLKLSEKEDNGLCKLYEYKTGTDLIIAQFTCNNNDIKIREFFEYDANNCLINKIIDNGVTKKINDLSGVTQRVITKYDLVDPLWSNLGCGQPKTVSTFYLDLQSGQEVLLNKIENTYNNHHLLTQQDIYDSDGIYRYSQREIYDDKDRFIETEDALGKIKRMRYDDNFNKIWEHQEGADFETHYDYDYSNRLTKITEIHQDGSTFINRFEYDYRGNKVLEVDPFGNETRYEYDELNRVIAISYPPHINSSGELIQSKVLQEYDIFNSISAITNASGQKTIFEHNSRKQPLKIQHPDGTTERFEYNANGTLRYKWDKEGIKTAYNYDAFNRILNEIVYYLDGSLLSQKSYTYDAFHLLSETDAMGYTTYYSYDGAGRKVQEHKSAGEQFSKTTYYYDALGRLHETRNWSGPADTDYIASFTEYDYLNRVIEERSEDGQGTLLSKKTYRYDRLNNCIEEIIYINDTDTSRTQYTYNSKGLLTETTNALGFKTQYFYDFEYINAIGQKILKKTTIDALGNQTEEIFDALSRPSFEQRKNASGILLLQKEFFYDAVGNKIKEVGSVVINGLIDHTYTICWVYDSMNRLKDLIEEPNTPDEKKTSYDYDASSKIKTIYKPDGIQVIHTYDALGRLIDLCSSDNSIHYTYQYDLNNNPIRVVEENLQHINSRQYDAWNRLIEETLGDGYTVSYTYNPLGHVTKFTLPDSSYIQYSYTAGNLKQVLRYASSGQELYRHEYTKCDLTGRVLENQLIGVLGTLTHEWDALGRRTSSQCSFWSESIPEAGRDAVGNLKVCTHQDIYDSIRYTYSYDDLYQLTSEAGIASHTYENDSINNRLNKDNNVYTLDSLNRLKDDSKVQYIYDKNGNLIKSISPSETVEYTYDAFDRLIQLKKNDQLLVKYQYDSFHRRLSKQVFNWNGFSWQQQKTKAFIYMGQKEVGSLDDQRIIQELRVLGRGKGAEIGAAVSIELQGSAFSPIHDFRGNVCSLIYKDLYSVIEIYRYTAFGEEEILNIAGSCIATSELGNPWRFASKRIDEETDLVYYGRRYYSPKLGRWISPDPLGFSDGPNLYAFVHNNPLIYIDAFGLYRELSESHKREDTWCRAFARRGKGLIHGAVDFGLASMHDTHTALAQIGSADFDMTHQERDLMMQGIARTHAQQMEYVGNKVMNVFSINPSDFIYQNYRSMTRTGLEIGSIALAGHGAIKGAIAFQRLSRAPNQLARLGSLPTKIEPMIKQTCKIFGNLGKGSNGFSGRKNFELRSFFFNSTRQHPTTINGRQYCGHALDQMQNRGFTPTVVQEVIENGIASPNKKIGRIQFYDQVNNITVVTENEKVITITYGELK